jgi:hypothetical protein
VDETIKDVDGIIFDHQKGDSLFLIRESGEEKHLALRVSKDPL